MLQKKTISTKSILSGDIAQLKLLLCFLAEGDETAVAKNDRSSALMSRDQLFTALGQLQQSDLDPAQALVTGLEWISADQNINLDQADHLWLTFVDSLFFNLMSESTLDQELVNIVQQLRVPFAKAVLLDELLVNDESHIVRLFVELFIDSGRSWYCGLGRAGQSYFKKLVDVVGAIKTGFITDFSVIDENLAQLKDFSEKEEQRVARLEQRLLDTEIGQIRARRAQHVVIELFNESLAGKELPENISQFLLGPWQDELRLFQIQQGHDNDEWQRAKKLYETLAVSFQPTINDESRQRLYNIVPKLGKELARHIEFVCGQLNKYQSIIDEIEFAHIQILKGETIPSSKVPFLESPGSIAGVSTTVSAQLIKKAEELEEGGWLLYKTEEGDNIRCKLLSKIPDTDQLLFVNRNGLKVMQKGVEDMAFCLSTGVAKPISQGAVFFTAYQKSVQAVIEQFEGNQQAIRDRQAKKAQEAKKEEDQRIQAEQKRIEEDNARVIAAAKAMAEAEAIALAKLKADKELEEQARIDEIEKEKQQQEDMENELVTAKRIARLSLDSINIGAWVEIPDRDNVLTKCKLAVKINSSGKYIFVDRNGLKVAELLRPDLVDLLVEKKAKILELGEDFEERLAKVVGSLRRDKS